MFEDLFSFVRTFHNICKRKINQNVINMSYMFCLKINQRRKQTNKQTTNSYHHVARCSHSPAISAPPQTPVTYSAANTADLEHVVKHVKGLYPRAPVLGAGVSLGG